MNTKNFFQTLAGVAQELLHTPRLEVDTGKLATQIDNLARQVRRQNNFWHRFVLGLATGIGTALGASVIATLIILILGPIFKAVGIDIDLRS